MNKMNKSEVFSWRLSPRLKSELERAAREEKTSISGLLDRISNEWLTGRRTADNSEQERLRAKLLALAGGYKGDAESATNARVRQVMGEQLMKKYRASRRRAPR